MSPSADLLEVAKRVAWFSDPETALDQPPLFLAHVMTYGTLDDVVIALRAYGLEGFRDALKAAPSGVFDARSWAFWNIKCGRCPAPPLPVREL